MKEGRLWYWIAFEGIILLALVNHSQAQWLSYSRRNDEKHSKMWHPNMPLHRAPRQQNGPRFSSNKIPPLARSPRRPPTYSVSQPFYRPHGGSNARVIESEGVTTPKPGPIVKNGASISLSRSYGNKDDGGPARSSSSSHLQRSRHGYHSAEMMQVYPPDSLSSARALETNDKFNSFRTKQRRKPFFRHSEPTRRPVSQQAGRLQDSWPKTNTHHLLAPVPKPTKKVPFGNFNHPFSKETSSQERKAKNFRNWKQNVHVSKPIEINIRKNKQEAQQRYDYSSSSNANVNRKLHTSSMPYNPSLHQKPNHSKVKETLNKLAKLSPKTPIYVFLRSEGMQAINNGADPRDVIKKLAGSSKLPFYSNTTLLPADSTPAVFLAPQDLPAPFNYGKIPIPNLKSAKPTSSKIILPGGTLMASNLQKAVVDNEPFPHLFNGSSGQLDAGQKMKLLNLLHGGNLSDNPNHKISMSDAYAILSGTGSFPSFLSSPAPTLLNVFGATPNRPSFGKVVPPVPSSPKPKYQHQPMVPNLSLEATKAADTSQDNIQKLLSEIVESAVNKAASSILNSQGMSSAQTPTVESYLIKSPQISGTRSKILMPSPTSFVSTLRPIMSTSSRFPLVPSPTPFRASKPPPRHRHRTRRPLQNALSMFGLRSTPKPPRRPPPRRPAIPMAVSTPFPAPPTAESREQPKEENKENSQTIIVQPNSKDGTSKNTIVITGGKGGIGDLSKIMKVINQLNGDDKTSTTSRPNLPENSQYNPPNRILETIPEQSPHMSVAPASSTYLKQIYSGSGQQSFSSRINVKSQNNPPRIVSSTIRPTNVPQTASRRPYKNTPAVSRTYVTTTVAPIIQPSTIVPLRSEIRRPEAKQQSSQKHFKIPISRTQLDHIVQLDSNEEVSSSLSPVKSYPSPPQETVVIPQINSKSPWPSVYEGDSLRQDGLAAVYRQNLKNSRVPYLNTMSKISRNNFRPGSALLRGHPNSPKILTFSGNPGAISSNEASNILKLAGTMVPHHASTKSTIPKFIIHGTNSPYFNGGNRNIETKIIHLPYPSNGQPIVKVVGNSKSQEHHVVKHVLQNPPPTMVYKNLADRINLLKKSKTKNNNGGILTISPSEASDPIVQNLLKQRGLEAVPMYLDKDGKPIPVSSTAASKPSLRGSSEERNRIKVTVRPTLTQIASSENRSVVKSAEMFASREADKRIDSKVQASRANLSREKVVERVVTEQKTLWSHDPKKGKMVPKKITKEERLVVLPDGSRKLTSSEVVEEVKSNSNIENKSIEQKVITFPGGKSREASFEKSLSSSLEQIKNHANHLLTKAAGATALTTLKASPNPTNTPVSPDQMQLESATTFGGLLKSKLMFETLKQQLYPSKSFNSPFMGNMNNSNVFHQYVSSGVNKDLLKKSPTISSVFPELKNKPTQSHPIGRFKILPGEISKSNGLRPLGQVAPSKVDITPLGVSSSPVPLPQKILIAGISPPISADKSPFSGLQVSTTTSPTLSSILKTHPPTALSSKFFQPPLDKAASSEQLSSVSPTLSSTSSHVSHPFQTNSIENLKPDESKLLLMPSNEPEENLQTLAIVQTLSSIGKGAPKVMVTSLNGLPDLMSQLGGVPTQVKILKNVPPNVRQSLLPTMASTLNTLAALRAENSGRPYEQAELSKVMSGIQRRADINVSELVTPDSTTTTQSSTPKTNSETLAPGDYGAHLLHAMTTELESGKSLANKVDNKTTSDVGAQILYTIANGVPLPVAPMVMPPVSQKPLLPYYGFPWALSSIQSTTVPPTTITMEKESTPGSVEKESKEDKRRKSPYSRLRGKLRRKKIKVISSPTSTTTEIPPMTRSDSMDEEYLYEMTKEVPDLQKYADDEGTYYEKRKKSNRYRDEIRSRSKTYSNIDRPKPKIFMKHRLPSHKFNRDHASTEDSYYNRRKSYLEYDRTRPEFGINDRIDHDHMRDIENDSSMLDHNVMKKMGPDYTRVPQHTNKRIYSSTSLYRERQGSYTSPFTSTTIHSTSTPVTVTTTKAPTTVSTTPSTTTMLTTATPPLSISSVANLPNGEPSQVQDEIRNLLQKIKLRLEKQDDDKVEGQTKGDNDDIDESIDQQESKPKKSKRRRNKSKSKSKSRNRSRRRKNKSKGKKKSNRRKSSSSEESTEPEEATSSTTVATTTTTTSTTTTTPKPESRSAHYVQNYRHPVSSLESYSIAKPHRNLPVYGALLQTDKYYRRQGPYVSPEYDVSSQAVSGEPYWLRKQPKRVSYVLPDQSSPEVIAVETHTKDGIYKSTLKSPTWLRSSEKGGKRVIKVIRRRLPGDRSGKKRPVFIRRKSKSGNAKKHWSSSTTTTSTEVSTSSTEEPKASSSLPLEHLFKQNIRKKDDSYEKVSSRSKDASNRKLKLVRMKGQKAKWRLQLDGAKPPSSRNLPHPEFLIAPEPDTSYSQSYKSNWNSNDDLEKTYISEYYLTSGSGSDGVQSREINSKSSVCVHGKCEVISHHR